MTSYRCKTKASAKARAVRARNKGFSATIYKKEKGYGVSVTRRKK